MNNLEERVYHYRRLTLPGQPQSMHLPTSSLIRDLLNEVKRLRAEKPVMEVTADKIFEIAAPRNRGDTAVAFTRERLQDALDTIREEAESANST